MSFKRTFSHRMIKARADNQGNSGFSLTPSDDPLDPDNAAPVDSPAPSSSSSPSPSPSSTNPSTKTTATQPTNTSSKPTDNKPPPSSSTTPTTHTQTHSSSKPDPPATSVSTSTDTSTTPSSSAETSASESTSSTSSDASSSTSTSASVSATASSTSASTGPHVVSTTGLPAGRPTTTPRFGVSSFAAVSPTDLSFGPSAISSTPTSALATSGGASTGSIIGGVVGGLAALGFLGLIIIFFLRRWNRRTEYEPNTFRRSAMLETDFVPVTHGSTAHNDTYNPRPPTMIERRLHDHTGAGAGVAGQGAYRGPAAMPSGYAGYDMYGNARHGGDDMSGSEAHGGAYSAEPQIQGAYDAEAYGSYAYAVQGYPLQHDVQHQGYHHDVQQQQGGYQYHDAQQYPHEVQQQDYIVHDGPDQAHPHPYADGNAGVGRRLTQVSDADAYGGI